MTRVAVFVDYQNAYMRAREAFGVRSDPSTFGQIDPHALGALLCAKGTAVDPARVLRQVRLYRGEPDVRRNAAARTACRRQVQAWQSHPAVVAITRPLHYLPSRWDGLGRPSAWVAREKGIDVLLALDLVTGAVRDEYDVGVLMSADTDLVPALEAAIEAGKACRGRGVAPGISARLPPGRSGAAAVVPLLGTDRLRRGARRHRLHQAGLRGVGADRLVCHTRR